ncbi:MAG: uroporphyrinogen-III C-methyltransferase [Leptospirales bacterium]|nr:uroporphyrinogen-III C-methyltransferase [Leptospirales bacterium]
MRFTHKKLKAHRETKSSGPAVSLVGAGPGDPELLTLRALRRLQEADVVLYDRLICIDVLKLAQQATLVPVGKKPGRAGALRQDRICRLLIRYASAGFRVVRLKGGDPFVFGRGGEEALALSAAGIDFEVVPGVSSFYAAPAAAGIPITHRGLAGGFAVFTAQQAEGNAAPPWQAAVQMPTAVFVMGATALSEITRQLILHGRSPETPAALISRATWPDQEVICGSLDTIAALAAEAQSPACLIVGEVVALRAKILGLEGENDIATDIAQTGGGYLLGA